FRDQRRVAKCPGSSAIPAGPGKALRQPCFDGVLGGQGDDWNRPCRVASGRQVGASNYHVRIEFDQFASKRPHAFCSALTIANDDRHVAAFHISEVAQGGPEGRHERFRVHRRDWRKHADPGANCTQLREPRNRPSLSGRGAAEHRDELAPAAHSITSAARASTVVGTSRPSALAVLRLITSSYFVGACTGRSAGFSPLRMRSMYLAACLCGSMESAP